MMKIGFSETRRRALIANGWTFGHALLAISMSSLFMFTDVSFFKETGMFVFLVLCQCLLFFSPLFKFSKEIAISSLALMWGIYFCHLYSFGAAFCLLFTWPAVFFLFFLLIQLFKTSSNSFFISEFYFEFYKLSLGGALFVMLFLLDSRFSESQFSFWLISLVWSGLLLTGSFLWLVRFPYFLKTLESCAMIAGLMMLYHLSYVPQLSNAKALFIMAFIGSRNMLLWPSKRREKPFLEYLQWRETSDKGVGMALFLLSEQWSATPIYYRVKEIENREGWNLLSEDGCFLEDVEALIYLFEASGGLWLVLSKFIKSAPLFLKKIFADFFYYVHQNAQNKISFSQRQALEKRKR